MHIHIQASCTGCSSANGSVVICALAERMCLPRLFRVLCRCSGIRRVAVGACMLLREGRGLCSRARVVHVLPRGSGGDVSKQRIDSPRLFCLVCSFVLLILGHAVDIKHGQCCVRVAAHPLILLQASTRVSARSQGSNITHTRAHTLVSKAFTTAASNKQACVATGRHIPRMRCWRLVFCSQSQSVSKPLSQDGGD